MVFDVSTLYLYYWLYYQYPMIKVVHIQTKCDKSQQEVDWDSQSLYTAAILENDGPNLLEHPPGVVRRFGGLRMESV